MRPDDARPRLAALGFRAEDVEVLAAHFLDAEATGRESHGVGRIEWLETWPGRPAARPGRVVAEPGYERWDGGGALGYLVLDAVVEASSAEPPARARLVGSQGTRSPRACSASGCGVWRTAGSSPRWPPPRRAASPPPAGGPKLTGTNPLAIAIPSSDGRPIVVDVSMGNLTYGDVLAGKASRRSSRRSVASRRTRRSPSPSACNCSSTRSTPDDGYGAVLLVARPETDPVPAFRRLAASVRLPGDRRA